MISPASQLNCLGSFFVRCSSGSTAQHDSVHHETDTKPKILRRRAVHVVHRHGDRSPITPLKDEAFWASQLVTDATLSKIASDTKLLTVDATKKQSARSSHPFGQLTEIGVTQLIELGSTLRGQLSGENEASPDEHGRILFPHIWTAQKPLHPSNIRVISTDFFRTIQSVQSLLMGLFPGGKMDTVPIDVRHTLWMIPDHKPRRTEEQVRLEEKLSSRPHVEARERELLPLAIRATRALNPMLSDNAREAEFGVSQKPIDTSSGEQPLSWNQLAEITKCLAVRDLLPDGISREDQEAISGHVAWRWFQVLRHPRLVHVAMGIMVETMINYLQNFSLEPPMIVWSAHDSTLIGLICAFRLEEPAIWPEYGSYLMVELLEGDLECDLFVRFSLNGQVLKSQWGEHPVEMISLTTLAEEIRSQAMKTK